MDGMVTPLTVVSGALRRKLAQPMPYQPLLHCVKVQAYGAERGVAAADETARRRAVERRIVDVDVSLVLAM